MLQVDEAQACLKQAQEYWQSQHWQKTIETCAQALALNQNLPLAHKLMGDALQRSNKAKEAIGYYSQAIALQPNFTEVYANLGTLYAKQQQYQQAINYYQQALKIDPSFTAVHKPLARAKLLLQQNRDRHIAANNLDLTRSLQQAMDLKQQGELEAALKQYLRAAKLRPQRVETYQEIIKLYEKLGLWADAAKYCRLVLKLSNGSNAESTSLALPSPEVESQGVESNVESNNIVPISSKKSVKTIESKSQSQDYLALGNTLMRQGNYNGAIDCYRRLIKQQPQLSDGYLALGELLLKKGQIDRVVSLYLSGLKHQQHPELYFALGKVYHGKQQWAKAALCYQKSLQLDSQQAQVCHELGEVLTQQQQWSEAVKAYRLAIALKTDFSWTYNNLGYALIQLNKWSEAISAYLQAIKLKPDFAWSYYNLAEAYGKLGQWAKAIASYQQAAKLQPDLPQVQQKLGDAFYRRSQQDRQQALEHFRLAIAQDPHNPEVYHQALAIDNRNLDLYLKLGDILANSGKPEQALITYQMAFEIQPKNTEILARISQYQGELNLPVTVDSDRVMQPTIDYEAYVAELEQILPYSDSPSVSIIIPVYNQLDYTLKCLKAIAVNLDKSLQVEIILVNDCSTDSTAKILEPLTAVNLVNQTTNSGFIRSCNLGATKARGEYIYFLNNDTEIKPNCIASLVEVFADQSVGAAGSKLVYPQGSLQEAGGIVWSDASGWNYGRQDNPFAPEYNYLREVDYCSGASLMVRKDIFTRLNGFEQDFVPAYYEDTDLCFAIRHQLGMKVMYQPKSEVIHYEGISSGTSVTSGTKKYQVVNAAKFKQKWQANLERDNYLPNIGIINVPASARKYLGQQTILVVDSYMPSYDRESGSRRLFELLKIFKRLGYHVVFAADNGVKQEPYASVLQNLQIEVLYTQDGYGQAIESQIESRLPLIDLAWICRPELNQKYAGIIRQQPEIKLIYDTIDLHYLRLKRAWELSSVKSPEMAAEWIDMQSRELKMAHQADLTITITPVEQKILADQSVENIVVVPNIHTPYQGDIPGFESRSGILFIGSYNHPPNIDAVLWLCQEIMPLVWAKNPEITVTLLGNNPNEEVMALQSDRVKVTGYVEDVSPYFLSHKMSVSPLRYGAGMKGKIGQSLEYGLPVVSTKIGTEGMNLIHQQHILEADHAAEFANQILLLYNNSALWQQLTSNAVNGISAYIPATITDNLRTTLADLSTSALQKTNL